MIQVAACLNCKTLRNTPVSIVFPNFWQARDRVLWCFIKGGWEAIFQVTDDFYLMKGGVRLYIWWLLPDEGWCETLHLMTFIWWRVVWRPYIWWLLPGEGWCETYSTSDDFYLMKGGVTLYIRCRLGWQPSSQEIYILWHSLLEWQFSLWKFKDAEGDSFTIMWVRAP